ncbi:MAG TPA: ABC transporter permease [Acidobacteriaceae bacterium]|jgi:putative ABC transport system permease protein|nr:ABC transporter permease [Acidobacteriaceae bacterium]
MAAERTRRLSFERTIASARQTIMLSEIAKLAIDSFRSSKVRFVLTALGMVIGTASVILVVAISATGRQYILSEIQGIGTNLVELEYAGGGSGAVTNIQSDFLTFDDEHTVDEQVPSVSASSVVLEMHQNISISGAVREVLVLGVEPQYRQVRNLVTLAGRFFDDEDETAHAKVAVVTEPFARAMFGSPAEAIGGTFQISGIPFTIIGTFKERVETFGETEIADQTILIPYAVGRYFSGTDNVKEMYFSIRDQSAVEDAARQIRSVIRNDGRHQPTSVYTTQTMTALITLAGEVVNALTAMLLLVSGVTLAVGGVGIMNIMLATVRARTREIGIRKALGATRREIKLQFLMEAMFVSLFGGLIGAIIGLAIPFSVRFFTAYRVPVSGWSAVIGLLASASVGILFGTLPANRAAAMDPIDSLRYE